MENSGKLWKVLENVDRPLKPDENIYLVNSDRILNFDKDKSHIPFNGVLVEEVVNRSPLGLLERVDNALAQTAEGINDIDNMSEILNVANLNNVCGGLE